LFIAHPKSQAARDRILELFILEYVLEKKALGDFNDFNQWAKDRSYPTLPISKLEELCEESAYLNSKTSSASSGGGTSYTLTSDGLATLEQARRDFKKARAECIKTVEQTIVKQCGTSKATEAYDLDKIVEEYLCAIFSEIRMMANYFRETSQVFAAATELDRFDYILKRHLPFNDGKYFGEWKTAFVEGLKTASGGQNGNGYVAAVFHNVLATYYLNRSTKPSADQVDKLAARQIYVDTNVLYAMKVEASTQHQAVRYFLDRLAGLQVVIRVFPFTVEEYENSLALTEQEVKKNEVSTFLLKWNPWLYQEFMLNKGRYLGQIEVCRQRHSVSKGKQVNPQSYDALDAELAKDNMRLDRDFVKLSQEEQDTLWSQLRQYMTASSWSIDDYYGFIQESTKSRDKIAHDTDCIYNLNEKFNAIGRDELGPKLMFITLDRGLARARKKFEFVVSSEQFLEFMMPYLFLNDAPVKDAERFPNQLLSAPLGTLLKVVREVEATDLVRGFLTDPTAADQYEKGQLGPVASEIATTLSSSRFQGVVEQVRDLDEPQMREVADQIAEKFDQMETQQKVSYYESQSAQFSELKFILTEKDRQIVKLQKTLKYLKRQRPRGGR